MTPESDKTRPGCRIVIGIRPAVSAEASIETAATLATTLTADIVGLFVEEESLLRLASLPFTKSLPGTVGATTTAMTQESMHARMQQLARKYQRTLSTTADEANIKWSFQITSGELLNSIQSALQAGDYLIVPCEAARHDFLHVQKLIAELTVEIKGVVLTPAYASSSTRYPIVVLIDCEKGMKSLLDLASSLAQRYRSSVKLFVVAASQEKFHRLQATATGMLAKDVSVTTYQLALNDSAQYSAAMRQIDPAYTIANIDSAFTRSNGALAAIYTAAKAPLILLR